MNQPLYVPGTLVEFDETAFALFRADGTVHAYAMSISECAGYGRLPRHWMWQEGKLHRVGRICEHGGFVETSSNFIALDE